MRLSKYRFVDLSHIQYTTKASDIQPFWGMLIVVVVASNAQVYTLCCLLGADSPPVFSAAAPDAQAAVGVCRYIPAEKGYPGRAAPGGLTKKTERPSHPKTLSLRFSPLLVDRRPSSLCHFATNEPQSM